MSSAVNPRNCTQTYQYLVAAWDGADPQNTSVNRDYNTYYEPLIQGLIATWPKDSVKSEQQFEALHEFFVDELEYIQTLPERDEGLQITSFSRLDYFCRFVRRLCSVLERVEFAHAMDLELANVFLTETAEETDSDSNEGEVDATMAWCDEHDSINGSCDTH